MTFRIVQYTGNLTYLLNWELDSLDYWQEVQEIISDALPYPDELSYIQIWFAYEGKHIVGYIMTGDNPRIDQPECWRISVAKEYRGYGIGTQLVEKSGLFVPATIEGTTEAQSFWASIRNRKKQLVGV